MTRPPRPQASPPSLPAAQVQRDLTIPVAEAAEAIRAVRPKAAIPTPYGYATTAIL